MLSATTIIVRGGFSRVYSVLLFLLGHDLHFAVRFVVFDFIFSIFFIKLLIGIAVPVLYRDLKFPVPGNPGEILVLKK